MTDASSLSRAQRRMLEVMVEAEDRDLEHGWRRERPAAAVAHLMWPDSPAWKHYYNSGGHGAPLPRAAGAMLNRLHRGGWVERRRSTYNDLWCVSQQAVDALDARPRVGGEA